MRAKVPFRVRGVEGRAEQRGRGEEHAVVAHEQLEVQDLDGGVLLAHLGGGRARDRDRDRDRARASAQG